MHARKFSAIFTLLLLIVLISLVSASSAQRGTATPTPATAGGQTPPRVTPDPTSFELRFGVNEGNLDNNQHRYHFEGETGQLILLSLNTDAFDPAIEVVDSSGFQAGYDDDSGPGNNSMLLFVVPANDEYQVIVRPYSSSNEVSGSYILRAVRTITELAEGDSMTVEIDGEAIHFFSIEVDGAIAVTVGAEAVGPASVDTTLTLYDLTGAQLAYNDDFDGVNPQIRRHIVGESGRYFLMLAPYSESAVGEVVLTYEQTQLLRLGLEPITIPFGGGLTQEVFKYEVASGTLYEIRALAAQPTSGEIRVEAADGSILGTVSFSSSRGGSLYFTSPVSADLRVVVTYNDYSDQKIDLTLTARPLE